MRKKKKHIFIFWYILLGLFILGGIYFMFFYEGATVEHQLSCGDSTLYGACSLDKPYFCEGGILVESALDCGCSEGFWEEGNKCVDEKFFGEKEIELNYFFKGEEGKINLVLYEGIYNYVLNLPRSINYVGGELPQRSDFKLMKINDEIQREALLSLVKQIENLAPGSKVNQARIAISLVQNLDYLEPGESEVLKGVKLRVSRHPYQTLYEDAGSCEGKSELLVFLLREIGYGTSLFYYGLENHEAVGIKCPYEDSLDLSGYCFVETTAPSILGDDTGEYPGTGRLLSIPEVVLISDGISLPPRLDEYRDGKMFGQIQEKIREKGKINFYEKWRLEKLLEKYYGF